VTVDRELFADTLPKPPHDMTGGAIGEEPSCPGSPAKCELRRRRCTRPVRAGIVGRGSADFANEAREYWARIWRDQQSMICAQKCHLTRRFGTSRADDHDIRQDQPGHVCHLVVRIT
jgi:hypothetical protein